MKSKNFNRLPNDGYAMLGAVRKRGSDNGKRKPAIDEYGNKWCACITPKLTSHMGLGKGQATCLKCGYDWYH